MTIRSPTLLSIWRPACMSSLHGRHGGGTDIMHSDATTIKREVHRTSGGVWTNNSSPGTTGGAVSTSGTWPTAEWGTRPVFTSLRSELFTISSGTTPSRTLPHLNIRRTLGRNMVGRNGSGPCNRQPRHRESQVAMVPSRFAMIPCATTTSRSDRLRLLQRGRRHRRIQPPRNNLV